MLYSHAEGATSARLSWNPSAGASGYRVVYGVASGTYTYELDVGNSTTATVSNLDDSTTYYFAVKAYDAAAVEGEPSNEVSLNQALIVNLSARVVVGTANCVAIDGFIISGTAPKTMIVRAIGPSLNQYGVAGAIADPILELYDAKGALIASNDNWRDTQEAAFAEAGAYHNFQPSSELESAIAITLSPGSYTAVVKGKNGSSGVALVELYDYSPNGDCKLLNTSSRAMVGNSDNVLIGGIMVDGNGSATRSASLILRAIGPSLRSYGVKDALDDPTLALYDTNGTLIGLNDDWGENSDQAIRIAASGFAPSNPLESAMAVTLTEGNYTAIVRGKQGLQGVALFEAYQVP